MPQTEEELEHSKLVLEIQQLKNQLVAWKRKVVLRERDITCLKEREDEYKRELRAIKKKISYLIEE